MRLEEEYEAVRFTISCCGTHNLTLDVEDDGNAVTVGIEIHDLREKKDDMTPFVNAADLAVFMKRVSDYLFAMTRSAD